MGTSAFVFLILKDLTDQHRKSKQRCFGCNLNSSNGLCSSQTARTTWLLANEVRRRIYINYLLAVTSYNLLFLGKCGSYFPPPVAPSPVWVLCL